MSGGNRKWRLASLLAASLLMLAAPAQASPEPVAGSVLPPKISAEDFGELPFISDLDLSPDGTQIVSRATVGGKTRLVVFGTTEARGMKHIDLPSDVHLLWATWAGKKVLASLAIPDELYNVKFHATRLLLYDPATGAVQRLADKVRTVDADNVIHIDPAGKFVLLSAARRWLEFPAVWRIDLESFEVTQVVGPQEFVWRWFADSTGAVRAGLGLEGNRFWVLYRENANAKFRRILKTRLNDKEDDSNIELFIPIAGSDKGYAVADKGSGRFGFYRYDFATDTLGEPLFEHPEVDVDSYTYSHTADDIAAIHYIDDRDRILWLDPELKKVQARIDRTFPDTINRIVSQSQNGRRMIVQSSGADETGTYFLYDLDKRIMSPIADPYAALAGKTLSKVEHVRYKARDGLQIPAYLTLPAGRPNKSLPLIVMPHGGPFVRDKWQYDPWVQFLANRGYAVLQPNFRGSTGYGKAFVEAGEGQWGRKMQDDLDDGVRWLAAAGTIDPKRVCMMGASYGGYAALWAAARNPDVYRCAISFAGISDLDGMLRYDKKTFTAERYYRDWRDRVRGEKKFDLDSVSPLKAVSRISIPLLIAHGKDDRTVPVNQSVKLHEALEKAGKPHDYVIYEGEGHGFSKVENSVDFLKRIEAFLAKHNPAS